MKQLPETMDFNARVLVYVKTADTKHLARLTVSRLAEGLDMSQSSFYTYFEQEFGRDTSPAAFLLAEKLLRANVEMEKNPGISIKELSRALGFKCTDYFIRVFKENLGVTPGTLIRKCREKQRENRKNANERKAKSRQRRKTVTQNA